MKSKNEVSSMFQKFHRMIATQYQSYIQVVELMIVEIEFVNQDLKQYRNLHGTAHHTTCSCSGVQSARTIFLKLYVIPYSGLTCPPITGAKPSLQQQPTLSIMYLPVHCSSTLFNVLHETVNAPTVSNLSPRIFGCVAFVHVHKSLRNKLEPRVLWWVFVGYASHQKGYRSYPPPSRKIYVTLDVVFHEDDMY